MDKNNFTKLKMCLLNRIGLYSFDNTLSKVISEITDDFPYALYDDWKVEIDNDEARLYLNDILYTKVGLYD